MQNAITEDLVCIRLIARKQNQFFCPRNAIKLRNTMLKKRICSVDDFFLIPSTLLSFPLFLSFPFVGIDLHLSFLCRPFLVFLCLPLPYPLCLCQNFFCFALYIGRIPLSRGVRWMEEKRRRLPCVVRILCCLGQEHFVVSRSSHRDGRFSFREKCPPSHLHHVSQVL
jgi:hypothetical protein